VRILSDLTFTPAFTLPAPGPWWKLNTQWGKQNESDGEMMRCWTLFIPRLLLSPLPEQFPIPNQNPSNRSLLSVYPRRKTKSRAIAYFLFLLKSFLQDSRLASANRIMFAQDFTRESKTGVKVLGNIRCLSPAESPFHSIRHESQTSLRSATLTSVSLTVQGRGRAAGAAALGDPPALPPCHSL